MVKSNTTTITQPKDQDINERLRRDVARDVRHAVHAKRATIKLLRLKVHGLLRKPPAKIEGN